MKVQCDVCAAEAASVFCCADEAALCDACDRRVHRANKLAGKHRRFSLLHPCSSSSAAAQKPPLCDICQERRGFLFCKEDRAILCRECDPPVHNASDMTRRHSRFLLTGVRLSSAPVESAGPSEEEEEEQENSTSPCNDGSCSGGAGAGATTASASDGSSISEYLTKTLPGWHVEDFLIDDASAADVVGACSDGLYQQGQHGQISGVLQEAYMGREQVLADVVDERASWERWVPQTHAEFAGDSNRPRASPSPPCSYW
ncbi:B-box zinc finger protein 20-like isoform X1 [Miscanthus floridulus]|uniref:B-box zinc finger protein 20-like isoform X1 n=1 Tax=Miscanthus floridulus TaxID=154761 RepID=UPI00345952A5